MQDQLPCYGSGTKDIPAAVRRKSKGHDWYGRIYNDEKTDNEGNCHGTDMHCGGAYNNLRGVRLGDRFRGGR